MHPSKCVRSGAHSRQVVGLSQGQHRETQQLQAYNHTCGHIGLCVQTVEGRTLNASPEGPQLAAGFQTVSSSYEVTVNCTT